jgi:outer membrane autotransporter protein
VDGNSLGVATVYVENGSSVSGTTGAAIHMLHNGTLPAARSTVVVKSGSTLSAGNGNIVQVDQGGMGRVVTDSVALAGNVLASGSGSDLQLDALNSSIAGNINVNDGAVARAVFIGSSLAGNVAASGAASQATIGLGEKATLTGNAAATGGATVSVYGDHSSSLLRGAVTADNANATVQLTNGAHVTDGMRLTNGANGTVLVDGNGSTLARTDGAAVDLGAGSKATISVVNGGALAGANGVLVNATGASNATVTLANTTLNGDMTRDASSTLDVALVNGAVLTGNLAASTLAVGSGSTWNMGNQAQQSVGALTLDNGRVNFASSQGAFKTLSTGSLQGNGTIHMGVDFDAGAGNDFLAVAGAVHGAPLLDPVEEDQGVKDPRNHVKLASTGGGDPLALVGEKIDAGVYTYRLEKEGDNWVLVRNGSPDPNPNPDDPHHQDPDPQPGPNDISPAAQTALSVASAAPWIWYGELGTLRLREGDLRANRAGSGVWVRTYSSFSRLDQTAAPNYGLNQYGLTAGADKRLVGGAGDWYVGGFSAYSYSTIGINGGSSGKVDSYSLGGYATWMGTDGWYADGVLKANEFDNDIRVVGSDGRRTRGGYRTPALGASLEVGKHVALPNQGFVEPYLQVAGVMTRSSADKLDSGFNIQTGVTKSLQSELGMLTGTTFEYGNHRTIQPYIRAALGHEFVSNNRVVLNGREFTNGTSGTLMKVGLGVAAQLRDNLQVHLDADYATGGPLEHATHYTLGMRYAF